MIKEFIERFDASRAALAEGFRASWPDDYGDIVKRVVEVIAGDEDYGVPDPERIEKIDHGDYQGTLVYVVGARGYQPWDYWFVKVGYGSCSGCDTLEGIREYSSEPANEAQVSQLMQLALNVVQELKAMQ